MLSPPEWDSNSGESSDDDGSISRHLLGEHHHDHHHSHSHHHEDPTASAESALRHLKESLRGARIDTSESRMLQAGGDYIFQADMYIEVDDQLIEKNGDFQNTIQYVNRLITATNTIFEVSSFSGENKVNEFSYLTISYCPMKNRCS